MVVGDSNGQSHPAHNAEKGLMGSSPRVDLDCQHECQHDAAEAANLELDDIERLNLSVYPSIENYKKLRRIIVCQSILDFFTHY